MLSTPQTLLVGAALLILTPGCESSATPEVEIGTGEIEFQPLDDGDMLDIIQGPQGGFHLLGSLRVKGIEAGDRSDLESPDNPTVIFAVDHEGVELITIGSITQGLNAAPLSQLPFTHQMTGRFAILDIAADDELDGETVQFSVSVADSNGVEVFDSVTLNLIPNPNNL